MKPQVLFLVGPTASGKSKLAMEIARRVKGEIISADSMQVYRGMDIGTAKPSKADQKKIPHHLIDILSPSRPFSAFEYRKLALRKIHEVLKRKHLPIVVGGSGLYVRALLEGFSGHPGASLSIRKKLAREAETKGLDSLYRRLQDLDPLSAAKISPKDSRRILRGLEIFEKSGKKPSDWYQLQGPLNRNGFQSLVIGIRRDRAELYEAINQRVETMVRRGLFREVKRLKKKRLSQTASQAVGYKEILQALGMDQSVPMILEAIKRNTRRLAKRQGTWFKREKGIEWILWPSHEDTKVIADKVIQRIQHAPR